MFAGEKLKLGTFLIAFVRTPAVAVQGGSGGGGFIDHRQGSKVPHSLFHPLILCPPLDHLAEDETYFPGEMYIFH